MSLSLLIVVVSTYATFMMLAPRCVRLALIVFRFHATATPRVTEVRGRPEMRIALRLGKTRPDADPSFWVEVGRDFRSGDLSIVEPGGSRRPLRVENATVITDSPELDEVVGERGARRRFLRAPIRADMRVILPAGLRPLMAADDLALSRARARLGLLVTLLFIALTILAYEALFADHGGDWSARIGPIAAFVVFAAAARVHRGAWYERGVVRLLHWELSAFGKP